MTRGRRGSLLHPTHASGAFLILLCALTLQRAGELEAQNRPKEIECSFLLFSGCRSYAIDVIRVEPGGGQRAQTDADTYVSADSDTLDPDDYLVLKLYSSDRLEGNRAVIWVSRASGAVGGDWPSTLSNDAVRSAELAGTPGDGVELYNDLNRRAKRGLTRLVIHAGQSACRTEVNLNASGGCSVREGSGVAGKVSRVVIRYRGIPAEPGAEAPTPGAPGEDVLPPEAPPVPADSAPAPAAPADSVPGPAPPGDSVPPAATPADSVPGPAPPADGPPAPAAPADSTPVPAPPPDSVPVQEIRPAAGLLGQAPSPRMSFSPGG